MNMQEMATAVTEGAPVMICLLNNQYLGMVRQMQQLFYGKRYEATCLRRRITCPENCKGKNGECPPSGFYAVCKSLWRAWHSCGAGRRHSGGFERGAGVYGCADSDRVYHFQR